MDIGEHDEGKEVSSPMSSSFLHENTAKMKVIITSSSSNHGLLNSNGGLPNPTTSLLNPSRGLPNPNVVTSNPPPAHPALNLDDLRVPASLELKDRKPVKYRECLRNHAANLGRYATDGCGEFLPGGPDGSLEALTCAACHCHRNFHRREVDGEPPSCADCARFHGFHVDHRKRLDSCGFPSPLPLASPSLQLTPPANMMMGFNPLPTAIPADSEYDFEGGGLRSPHSSSSLKKRFRTKFTAEQKEQMAAFAQRIGWRIQKQDEEAVAQFCTDVGVKRHVLKVWMHNNKLTVGKKLTHCLTMTSENPDMS